MLKPVNRGGWFDDDPVERGVRVRIHALDSAYQKPLRINSIKPCGNDCLAWLHRLVSRDTFKLAAGWIVSAHFPHRARVLQHSAHACLFVRDYLNDGKIRPDRYDAAYDSPCGSDRHIQSHAVERAQINSQASEPVARIARNNVCGKLAILRA